MFASSGLNFWAFFFATVLTLPKQLQVVYLGVVFDQTNQTTKSKVISDTVLALSFVITLGAAWYIYRQMAKYRPVVAEEKLLREAKAFSATNVSDFDLPNSGNRRPSARTYINIPDSSPPKPLNASRSSSYTSRREDLEAARYDNNHSPGQSPDSMYASHPYTYGLQNYPQTAVEYSKPSNSPFSVSLSDPGAQVSAPSRLEQSQAPNGWAAEPIREGSRGNSRQHSREHLAEANDQTGGQYIVP